MVVVIAGGNFDGGRAVCGCHTHTTVLPSPPRATIHPPLSLTHHHHGHHAAEKIKTVDLPQPNADPFKAEHEPVLFADYTGALRWSRRPALACGGVPGRCLARRIPHRAHSLACLHAMPCAALPYRCHRGRLQAGATTTRHWRTSWAVSSPRTSAPPARSTTRCVRACWLAVWLPSGGRGSGGRQHGCGVRPLLSMHAPAPPARLCRACAHPVCYVCVCPALRGAGCWLLTAGDVRDGHEQRAPRARLHEGRHPAAEHRLVGPH